MIHQRLSASRRALALVRSARRVIRAAGGERREYVATRYPADVRPDVPRWLDGGAAAQWWVDRAAAPRRRRP